MQDQFASSTKWKIRRIVDDTKYTPRWLRICASWGWRLLVLAGVLYVFGQVASTLSLVVIPVLLAIVLTAGLSPIADFLGRHKWPRWLSGILAMLGMFLIVGGLFVLVGTQVASQWDALADQATVAIAAGTDWLANGPLHVTDDQLQEILRQIPQQINEYRGQIAGSLMTAGSAVGNIGAGAVTTLFATFFFIKDGPKIAQFIFKLAPSYVRGTMEPAMRSGWKSLSSYVRAAIIVAGIDGLGAGLVALIMGSNLWLAITAVTFVFSFIPLVGAFIAGVFTTGIILVMMGWKMAVVMLVAYIVIINVEGNVLQPFLLGHAVSLHPLLVLLGITAGALIANIIGALLAIPILAFISGAMKKIDVTPEDDDAPDVSDAEAPSTN